MVPGFGSYRPRAMILGEAPGATENNAGRPFCGASGRVLHQLMQLAGLYGEDWEDAERKEYGVSNAFLTNVVKYRPPGNRTPYPEEIERARDYVRMEWIALGRPSCIVLVGVTAIMAIAPAIKTARPRNPIGQPFRISSDLTVWPMFHPAYALRNPAIRPTVEEHWEALGTWLRDEK